MLALSYYENVYLVQYHRKKKDLYRLVASCHFQIVVRIGWLVYLFNSISTFVGYLMPKLFS